MRELSLNLEEETVKETFAETMRQLSKAEREKDEARIRDLLARCQEQGSRLNQIKALKAKEHIQ
jgi:hypothetical protein